MPRKTGSNKKSNAPKKTTSPRHKTLQQQLGEESASDENDENNPALASTSFRSISSDDDVTDYGLDFTKSNPHHKSPRRLIRQRDTNSSTKSPKQQKDNAGNKSKSGIINESARQRAAESTSNLNSTTRSQTAAQTQVQVQRAEKKHTRRKPKSPKKRNHVLKEIKKLQSTTNFLIPRLPFGRLFREIVMNFSYYEGMRITGEALEALQEATEIYAAQLFSDSYRCTLHRGRVTLEIRDMELVRYLRGQNDPGNK